MCTRAQYPRLAIQAYPVPQPTNSLPITFRFSPASQTCLVIGSNRLAATRAFTFLEASADVIVASQAPLEDAAEELQWRASKGQIRFVTLPQLGDLKAWLEAIEGLSLVCVTETVITQASSSSSSSSALPSTISEIAQSLHIPINITDRPDLCTYTFPATHRFPSTAKTPSNLQISVTTNGQGCRLATRIKREIVSRLPRNVGRAVDNVGRLRSRAKLQIDEDDLAAAHNTPLNTPVSQLAGTPSMSRRPSVEYFTVPIETTLPKLIDPETLSESEQQLRRMRWISQISEYWSVEYLAKMTEDQMSQVLEMWKVTEVAAEPVKSASVVGGPGGPGGPLSGPLAGLSLGDLTGAGSSGFTGRTPGQPSAPRHDMAISVPAPPPADKPAGRILLLGSGPGHPGLLTIAAHRALLTSTLILSDKLVPAEILALIPSTTELHIAKKFPGNAEGAQNEMMALALAGAQRGEIVVRLKQGDPFVYGRGGEEVLFFREHGFEPLVVPGVSSALAGPLMMGIPVTQRGVAESLVLCTGVGRKGKAVQLPGYVKSRTLLVLMGVARINQVLDVLMRINNDVDDPETNGARDGAPFPPHLPIAIIERASSPDQRMIASTLDGIEAALERVGEQRPPGMMVIGWAALCLEGQGEVGVLDDLLEDGETEEEKEKRMVRTWLGGQSYVVREGLDEKWDELLPVAQAQAALTEL